MFSWFTKKKPSDENYEQILASLEISIQKRRTQLSEIRLRERRSTLLATTWAFSAWVAYVALWYAGIIGPKGRGGRRNVLWGLPVVIGPIVVLFTRRIVQYWYARKGNAEEKTLKELLIEQRTKIEEIKKKTNYYTTKSLLDRYDDGTKQSKGPSTPNGQRDIPPQTPQLKAPVHSQVIPNGSQAGHTVPQTPVYRNVPTSPYSPVVGQLPPPRKQWYDKLADALLGDDTASTGPSAASRYALICEKCFTHNGLVKEDLWEDAQYLCPKCGHFNKSIRARKALQATPTTPQSTTTSAILTASRTSEPSSVVPSIASPEPPPQDTTEPSGGPVTPFVTKRKFEKSPLSESTVFVEKPDVEEMDIDS